jgi:hypothetical protein
LFFCLASSFFPVVFSSGVELALRGRRKEKEEAGKREKKGRKKPGYEHK